MDAEERELWRTFAAAEPPEKERLRQKLIERFLPVVMSIADKLASKLPRSVEVQDLFQDGVFGLSDAVDRFQLDRGFKFPTYATQRIRGAMVDAMRDRDWVPRLVRTREE